MNNQMILLLIYVITTVLLSLLLILIPVRVMGVLTTPFSFRTFGIRKVKRWNSRTDTLGNIFLCVSVLFCIFFPIIPYAKWIYLVWMILTWLCAVSRAVRLTHVKSNNVKLAVIFFLNLTFGFGLLCGMGFLNNFTLWKTAMQWVLDIQSGEALGLLYYLNNSYFFAYLLQIILMMLPLIILWGQFKYMRLENTFKSRNIGLYCVKMVVWVLIILALGVYGYVGLEKAYNRSAGIDIATSTEDMPSDAADEFDLGKIEEEISGDNAEASEGVSETDTETEGA